MKAVFFCGERIGLCVHVVSKARDPGSHLEDFTDTLRNRVHFFSVIRVTVNQYLNYSVWKRD